MLKERQEFVAKTRREADELLEAARVPAERMVQRTEVVRAAEQRARQMMEAAETDSRRLRHETEDFLDQRLGSFEILLDKLQKTVAAGRQRLSIGARADAGERRRRGRPDQGLLRPGPVSRVAANAARCVNAAELLRQPGTRRHVDGRRSPLADARRRRSRALAGDVAVDVDARVDARRRRGHRHAHRRRGRTRAGAACASSAATLVDRRRRALPGRRRSRRRVPDRARPDRPRPDGPRERPARPARRAAVPRRLRRPLPDVRRRPRNRAVRLRPPSPTSAGRPSTSSARRLTERVGATAGMCAVGPSARIGPLACRSRIPSRRPRWPFPRRRSRS